ncbi:MAG: AraC family transcriptional regulator [Anaerocolumna sp.]
MKNTKRSIFHQILLINTLLSFLFICIFMLNYMIVNNKFKEDAEKYSEQIMYNMTANFQTETNRLTTFVKMCEDDPSFVLAMSNKLPVQKFLEYGNQASEKLLIIQYSLPYAEKVLAYIKNSGKFIMPRQVVVDKEYFLSGLSNDEQLPDFSKFGNGFYSIGGNDYFISNSYDYGSFIIQLNTAKFCGLVDVSSVLPDYEILVLYNNNKIFAASSKKAEKMFGSIDISQDKPEYIYYSGDKYYISKKTLKNNFRFILVEKASVVQKLQQQNNVIYIAAGFILFTGCILLVFLNTQIYLPLKRVVMKYNSQDNKHNEIEMINGMMNDILKENTQMQNQILNNQQVQSDIELNYAIHSKQKISEQQAGYLLNRYGKYRMMSIAIQNQTGEGEELFISVDDYLMDTMSCKSIVVNNYVHSYIIPEEHNLDEICLSVDKYFCNMKPTTMVFIGISDASTDFVQLYNIYRQSYERMLYNRIPLERRYSITVQDIKAAKCGSASISFEIQNTIAKYTLSGNPKDLEHTLEHIFFSDSAVLLQDMISYYVQLASLLLVVLKQANTVMEFSDFRTTQALTVYHPVYMYYLLLEDFKKLNAGTSQEHSKLRYEIIGYINEHYSEALGLDSISSHFGITPVYLSSWFKKNTGINLSVYINNIRMEEAKKLLLNHKNLKISDIAARIGISTASTFIRQFKNYAGCTPDQYRQLK